MKIGFIGFGRMGSALAAGAIKAGVLKRSQVVAYDHNKQAQAKIKKLGRLAKNAAGVLAKADLVFLCLKPQVMESALTELKGHERISKICFVSIAAGFPLGRLQQILGGPVAALRVMPNTPALLRAGISAVSRGQFATKAHESQVKKILSGVGQVVSVPEVHMDAVTAISGSGPAYVFFLAEALISGAAQLGLPLELAEQLVRQTIYGSGLMLAQRPEGAAELRRQVTSPGGTTAAAIERFELRHVRQVVGEAVRAATDRSIQLSKI